MIYKRGKYYWFCFRLHGERYRESTKKTNRQEAAEYESRFRNNLIDEGVGKKVKSKLRYEDLAAGIETDWRINNRRDLKSLIGRLKHLQRFFGGRSAESISSIDVRNYVKARLIDGTANATINRELSALKRAFKLAVNDELLKTAPHIAMLAEAEPRQGFFDSEKFGSVVGNLPEHLKPVATFACLTGWRRSEVTGLTWELVDLKAREIRLPSSMSKNKRPRFLPLEGELWEIIAAQRQTVGCPHVFHNNGKPVRTFYKAWVTACQKAGCPGMLFHDLRRTGARNLRRAGLSEEQAMRVTGHVTSSVFRRYDIQTDEDLRLAVKGAFAEAAMTKTGSE